MTQRKGLEGGMRDTKTCLDSGIRDTKEGSGRWNA